MSGIPVEVCENDVWFVQIFIQNNTANTILRQLNRKKV